MKSAALLALGCLLALSGRAERCQLQLNSEKSQIEVVVHATVDSFTGHLNTYGADVVYDTTTGAIERAILTFGFADIDTGKTERDRQMHEWQQTPLHPQGRFELTRLEPEQGGRSRAHGTLTLHGVSHAIQFPVALTRSASHLAIDGEAVIDVRDHGLKAIRKFVLLRVDPEVIVRFHLQGRLEPRPELPTAAPSGASQTAALVRP